MTHENWKHTKEMYLGCEIVIHRLGRRSYDGKSGIVEYVDEWGDLHGTWGLFSIIPGVDQFRVVSRPKKD